MGFTVIAVVGLGLIGGSLAKAFKSKGYEVIGVDSDDMTLKNAINEGCICRESFNINSGDEKSFEVLKTADAVFICTPVLSIIPVIKKILPFLKEGSIITDTGSTKRYIVNSARELINKEVEFIGGHPMAGSHNSGYKFSREDLFSGSTYFLTPLPDTSKEAINGLRALIKEIGAVPHIISPEKHDAVIAAISHLPQVAATCLVNSIRVFDGDGEYIRFAGNGFKDTTRIARSSPDIWLDILITNKDEVVRMISIYKDLLEKLKVSLEKSDDREIKNFFLNARDYIKRGDKNGCGN